MRTPLQSGHSALKSRVRGSGQAGQALAGLIIMASVGVLIIGIPMLIGGANYDVVEYHITHKCAVVT